MTIKELYRLNRHSDTLVILYYFDIMFEPVPWDLWEDDNEFGGESAASFLGIEENQPCFLDDNYIFFNDDI